MTVVFPKAFASPNPPSSRGEDAEGRKDQSLRRSAPSAALRETVRRLERGSPAATDHPAVPLGLPEIDAVLAQGGLATGALHEVLAGDPKGRPAAHDGAALGFSALLLGRFAAQARAGSGGRILWCRPSGYVFEAVPYPPALSAFLDPARLILANTRRREETLWALEEGLRCASLAAVFGEIDTLDLVGSRRLQLAAEKSGVPVLLLRSLPRAAARPGLPRTATTSAAVTRWRVAAVASASTPGLEDVGTPRWRLDLLRNRAGDPARHEAHSWTVEWTDEAHRLALVATALDRPAGPSLVAARRPPHPERLAV